MVFEDHKPSTIMDFTRRSKNMVDFLSSYLTVKTLQCLTHQSSVFNVIFLYPLKTLENCEVFGGIFKGYRVVILGWNGLI